MKSMENEEKRYTITKIEKIDSQISEAKKRIITGSIFVGVETLTIAAFLVNSINTNSGLGVISSITLGALNIYSFVDFKHEMRNLKGLKELRAKIVEEKDEAVRKVK